MSLKCKFSHFPRTTFSDDRNLGLVKQCKAQLYRRNIKQLTEVGSVFFSLILVVVVFCFPHLSLNMPLYPLLIFSFFKTFITLSLENIAVRAQLASADEAERIIVRMVRTVIERI